MAFRQKQARAALQERRLAVGTVTVLCRSGGPVPGRPAAEPDSEVLVSPSPAETALSAAAGWKAHPGPAEKRSPDCAPDFSCYPRTSSVSLDFYQCNGTRLHVKGSCISGCEFLLPSGCIIDCKTLPNTGFILIIIFISICYSIESRSKLGPVQLSMP